MRIGRDGPFRQPRAQRDFCVGRGGVGPPKIVHRGPKNARCCINVPNNCHPSGAPDKALSCRHELGKLPASERGIIADMPQWIWPCQSHPGAARAPASLSLKRGFARAVQGHEPLRFGAMPPSCLNAFYLIQYGAYTKSSAHPLPFDACTEARKALMEVEYLTVWAQ